MSNWWKRPSDEIDWSLPPKDDQQEDFERPSGRLPASGLTVQVHPAASGEPWVSRVPKGNRLLILISFAPLIIGGLVVVLVLNEPIVFLVAIAIIVGILVVGVLYQKSVSRQLYTSSPEDWMSKGAFFVGSFDATGLPGAAGFKRQHGRYGHPPQVRLVVSNRGLSFGPAGHRGSPVMLPFGGLQTVELIEGTHGRKLMATAPVAAQRGQVVVTTTQRQVAKFTGIPVEGIRTDLEDRGATIEAASS